MSDEHTNILSRSNTGFDPNTNAKLINPIISLSCDVLSRGVTIRRGLQATGASPRFLPGGQINAFSPPEEATIQVH